MEQLLAKIDRLKAELHALSPMKEEDQKRLDKKIRLEFNYNSNHLEGNTLTYGETELLLLFDQTKDGHTHRENEEMKAHDVAFQLVRQWAHDPHPLTEADIKQLNQIMLVRPYWKDAVTPDGQPTRRLITVGEYKKQPNSVRLENGEIFEYTSPTDTPIQMGELLEWFKNEWQKGETHPLLIAALFHYRFVRIHPFDDGNGRISRLLMNYVLEHHGFPPVIIKSTDKKNYLRALNRADAGEIEAFVQYIGEQLVWSLELSVKAAKGENIEEPDDLDKEIEVLKKKFTGQNKVTKKGDATTAFEMFRDNIIPFFITLENKANGLSELFFDTTRKMEIAIVGQNGKIPLKNLSWKDVQTTLFPHNSEGFKKQIASIDYQYNFKGFKGKNSANSYSIWVEIVFNEYNCTIRNQSLGTSITEIPYGQILTNEELTEITKPLVKQIVEYIKGVSN